MRRKRPRCAVPARGGTRIRAFFLIRRHEADRCMTVEQFEETRATGDSGAPVHDASARQAEALSPVINLRDTGRFLQVLEALKCSLAVSRRDRKSVV